MSEPSMEWKSDVIAQLLREMDMEYMALNPGSSFRGLHESIVNYLGNKNPEILQVCHEEHAVSIAHGYAKAKEKPMGAIVHTNVGLMHASMALYNAWCDRVPMIVLGGENPQDAARRRHVIDWLHAPLDQGGLVRDYVKWDDNPLSVEAAKESLLRAQKLSRTPPRAPVYITLDQDLQEEQLPPDGVSLPEMEGFQPASPPDPNRNDLQTAAEVLLEADHPVIFCGRVSRDREDWSDRVELAETLGAVVFTDLKMGASFPTDHPLHPGVPHILRIDEDVEKQLREADVILNLDWIDIQTPLKQVWEPGQVPATMIRASMDSTLHRSWSRDHQALSEVDIDLLTTPERAVRLLLDELRNRQTSEHLKEARSRHKRLKDVRPNKSRPQPPSGREEGIVYGDLCDALQQTREQRPLTLTRLPIRARPHAYPFQDPMDFLGYNGGAGVGSGPGITIGAALAMRNRERIPVGIIGDGDYLMAVNALWTAAHHEIPVLLIVANDTAYYNDYHHQRTISEQRGRTTSTAWVGQLIDRPTADLGGLATAQGWETGSPVTERSELESAFARGLQRVQEGAQYLIDVQMDTVYEHG